MADNPLIDSASKVAGNALEPLAKGIGNTLGDLWFLVFGPISHVADKRRAKYSHALDLYKKQLDEKISSIPPDRRIEPNTQVALKALTESQTCVEEPELRGMFSNLIASSMDSEQANKAHPGFASIISNLSSFDAQLFSVISDKNAHPIAQYKASDPRSHDFITLATNVLAIQGVILSDLTAVSQSIDILSAQGLIMVNYHAKLTAEGVYAPFEEGPVFESYKQAIADKLAPRVLKVEKGMLTITDLGKRFRSVCLS